MTLLKLVLIFGTIGLALWRGITVNRYPEEDPRREGYRHPHAGEIAGVTPRVYPLVAGALVVVMWFLIFPAVGFVDTGYRGVVVRWGAVTGRVLDEGIYLVVPVAEKVVEVNVQVRAGTERASASSKDLQVVSTEVTLNYALRPESVATVYQTLRQDYGARIIAPAIQESVKAVAAKYNAEELITKRETVREGIKAMLGERLTRYGIHTAEMSLTDFDFSDDFNRAIEAKVTAEQNALKAEHDLTRISTEGQQRVAQATAEAEAIRIQAQAIDAQGGENYVALKWVEKWNGAPPQYMAGSGGSNGFLFQVPGR